MAACNTPVCSCCVAAEIFNRPAPIGAFASLITAVEDFVCPPGTFVRTWDGRTDAEGLHALGLTCSDGSFIGSLGLWSLGEEEFMESTVADGYSGMTVALNGAGLVTGVNFINREGTPSGMYGLSSGGTVSTTCRDDERIVGLTTKSGSSNGHMGAFGLLCGKVLGE